MVLLCKSLVWARAWSHVFISWFIPAIGTSSYSVDEKPLDISWYSSFVVTLLSSLLPYTCNPKKEKSAGTWLTWQTKLTGVAELCPDHLHFKEFPCCVFKHLPSHKKALVSLTVESIMQPKLQMLPAVFLPHIVYALHNCHRKENLILTSVISVLELYTLNYQVELFS